MSQITLPDRHLSALLAGSAPVIGYRRDGRPIHAAMGADPETDAAAAAALAAAAAAGSGRAGGEEQLRVDLARERDRRQAAEADLAATRRAQQERDRNNSDAQTSAERQRLEGERDAATSRAAAAIARSVRADARTFAVEAGVRSERAETFLRLVDLTGVKVADDGTPDGEAIRTLVTAALTDAPEFRSTTAPGERRADQGAGHGAGTASAGDLQAQVSAQLAAMQDTVGIRRATS